MKRDHNSAPIIPEVAMANGASVFTTNSLSDMDGLRPAKGVRHCPKCDGPMYVRGQFYPYYLSCPICGYRLYDYKTAVEGPHTVRCGDYNT